VIDPLDGLLFVTKYSFNILIDQDTRILAVGVWTVYQGIPVEAARVPHTPEDKL
jgi:hypothetical protein